MRNRPQRTMTDGAPGSKAFDGENSLSEANIYVSLTYEPLDSNAALSRVKSPKAGAVVLFAGMQLLLAQCNLLD